MLLRGDGFADRLEAGRERADREPADPLVDSFAPLCAEAERLCGRLDPALGRVDELCAGLERLVGRLTVGLTAVGRGRPRAV
jgi:hypothetical protein